MNQGVAIIWEGDAIFANFRLPGDNKTFSGYIKQLCLKEDGNFYLSVANGHQIEQIAFNELTSSIKITINATCYSFKSLCKNVLKLELNKILKFADHVRKQLTLNEKYIFTFDLPTKVFITIKNYLKSKNIIFFIIMTKHPDEKSFKTEKCFGSD
ncbi:hypothetical protein [Gilliamella apicola]|uniref:hypothetical protein n=1 Tax=Gilliamella apicola TaxID=1196095 RepID=UPI003986C2FB